MLQQDMESNRGGEVFVRKVMLLASMLVVVVIAASPAVAQTQSQAALAPGAPTPPAYELERDGTLITGGDVVTDCSTFTAGFRETQERLQDEAQATADACERLGFPSGDFTIGNSEVILSLGTEGPPTPNADGGELPETGGPPLTALALGGGLLLIGGGLLTRRYPG